MSILNRRHLSDLRGIARLAVDATVGVTDIVEKMHHTIQLGHPPVGSSRANNTSGVTGLVYRSIRGVTRAVGKGLDTGLAPMSLLLPESASPPSRDALVSVINGLYGDHLDQTRNPLAIEMRLRYADEELDPGHPVFGQATAEDLESSHGKLMVFVHGLCLSDRHWTRDGVNHSQDLAKKLGFTPIYLRYNTGMPIAENGKHLASLLENLYQNGPFPLNSLVLVGHSMGGLVARSAAFHGSEANHAWLRYLSSMAFLGTPHHGAPLERGGKWLDKLLELSPYAAPFAGIGKKRSAGITGLRKGSISDSSEQTVPLPEAVNCYALAATLAKKDTRIHRHLIGDGLVPVDSALGSSSDPQKCLQIPDAHQWLVFETGHMELLSCAGAFERLHSWLNEETLNQ